MTDHEADKFMHNLRKDHDPGPVFTALQVILDLLGLLLIIVGAVWALPAVYEYNTGAGLAYIGVVMVLLSWFLRRI